MGTGVNMTTAEKIAALAARKAELEGLLAAKNEELYALCVQEVRLTGVVPPEAPLSPEGAPRERRPSVRSAANSDGDVDAGGSTAHTRRRVPDRLDHKHLAHRLSTPSISGASVRSSQGRHRRDSPRAEAFAQETFSMPSSQTFPNLAPRREVPPAPVYRHHTLTTDYMNKIYYTSPENPARLRETYFSSSHPDIATHAPLSPQASLSPPAAPERPTPLIYQYASQLKAQSQHLTGLSHHHAPSRRRDARRNTLQRTQTYHLTSHSDYPTGVERSASQRNIQIEREHLQRSYVPMEPFTTSQSTVVSPRTHRPLPEEPSGPASPTSSYNASACDNTSMYRFSMHEKNKEKQWYETSLDSPTESVKVEPPPRPVVKRSPSIGNSQPYEIMTAGNPGTPMVSPRPEVPLESPKNCTVVEQGKWIPYREVTKPFEMSDFYKYSTKFRQTNQKANGTASSPGVNIPGPYRSPPDVPQYAQDHWHGQNH